MSRGRGHQWDHGNGIPVHFVGQNERSRSDHDSSVPIHFPRTSSTPSSAYGNPMSHPFSGPSDWQPTFRFPTSSFRHASLDPRFVATAHGGPRFEEGAVISRTTHSRFPLEPYPPVRILVIRSIAPESGPRIAPFSSNPAPRFSPHLQETVHSSHDREAITPLEQEKALKTLKKQIYRAEPKSNTRRLSLYSRNSTGKAKESDEDSKRCSVCLEDFEIGNEVMVTPCNHVFHEECIVPWMKSNGQCPVCRYVVSEVLKANAMALSNASVPPPALLEQDDGPVIPEHVLSVIRAMDEAFSWGRSR